MYDNVKVLVGTAISTNAFTFPVRIHKVILNSVGTTALTFGIIAGTTSTVTADILVQNNPSGHASLLFEAFVQANFEPPVLMGDSIANTYVNFVGSGSWRVFYTRA